MPLTSTTRFLLTAILCSGLIGPLTGLPAWPPRVAVAMAQTPEAIAFTRGEWLYYLAAPAEKPRKLVQGRQPALSPDGKKLAYLQEAARGGNSLMILDLATGQSLTLVPPSRVRLDGPSWSPPGDTLAFISDMKEIVLIQKDGSGRRKIFSVPGGAYVPPAWSKSGKSLLVHDLNDIFQINLEGKQLAKSRLTVFTGPQANVTSVDRFVPNPQDSQLYAFTAGVEGTPQFTKTFGEPMDALFLYDGRTRQRTRLTPPDMLATSPCWSGDGQTIYFCGYREPHYRDADPFRIYRINRDGTGLHMLTKGQDPTVARGSGAPSSPPPSSPGKQAEPAPPPAKDPGALPPPPPMPE